MIRDLVWLLIFPLQDMHAIACSISEHPRYQLYKNDYSNPQEIFLSFFNFPKTVYHSTPRARFLSRSKRGEGGNGEPTTT